MLVDPDVSAWLQSVHEPCDRSPVAIESFINEHVDPSPVRGMPNHLRMTPPDEPESRIETPLSAAEVSCITAVMEKRRERYGAFPTECVSELPDDIRYPSVTRTETTWPASAEHAQPQYANRRPARETST